MKTKVSQEVNNKIKELYAVLAKAAAQRAVDYVVECTEPRGADKYVDAAVHWLSLAGAKAARWTYDRPRIRS